jgi:hypothetical protein
MIAQAAGTKSAPIRATQQRAGSMRFVGAEMRGGSDGPGRVPGAVMEFVRPLPPSGAPVLFAGPHGDELVVELVEAGYRVDLQLRALDDAVAASDRLPVSVRVHCGSMTRVTDMYDVVIALGGLDHLAGADAPIDHWTGALDALISAVAPGGLLAVVVRNGLGIDRVTSVAAAAGHRGDAFATQRARLHEQLARARFDIDAEVSLYPNAVAPSVLVPSTAFNVPGDTLAALIAVAYRPTVDRADSLVDPRRLARDSVLHELGPALAPGWLIVARRASSDAAPQATPEVAVVVADPPRHAFGSVAQRFTPRDGGSWTRTRLAGRALGIETHDGVLRDSNRLDGDVPQGQLLEEHLLDAAGAHDTLRLRDLLGMYARWLGVRTDWLRGDRTGTTTTADHPSAEPDEEALCPVDRVFAVADNVINDGGILRPFDPSWQTVRCVRADVAFVAALQRFSRRLLASALPHPWVVAESPVRLGTRLVSMVGLHTTAEMLGEAADLVSMQDMVLDSDDDADATNTSAANTSAASTSAASTSAASTSATSAVGTTPIAPDPTAAHPSHTVLIGPTAATHGIRAVVGPVDPVGPLVPPRGLAEALRTIDWLSAELAGAHEQLNMLAGTIAETDKRLAKVSHQLEAVKRFRLFRAVNAVRKAARFAIKGVRRHGHRDG